MPSRRHDDRIPSVLALPGCHTKRELPTRFEQCDRLSESRAASAHNLSTIYASARGCLIALACLETWRRRTTNE